MENSTQYGHGNDAAPPTSRTESPVIIGIGASAGGLEALRALFAEMQGHVSASLVVVQHMSPTSKSMLAELLARETNIPLTEARDGEPLLENHIYITPPNTDILVENRRIRLTALEDRIGPKPSIDRFLISVAQDYGEHGIACILSGTGSDGAQGCRAIKAAGGMALAQDPDTAKYDGMPRSAIATGVMDLVGSPAELAREICNLSVDNLGERPAGPEVPDETFKQILRLLHQRTKVNFGLYKPNTISRRLNRRVNAVKAKSVEEYFDYLQKNPEEVERLHHDILISVTSFFRDADQFEAAGKHLRAYIDNNRHKETLRIWSAGCASGEEPYSLAIAALEAVHDAGLSPADMRIQVFATDINEAAMTTARAGQFPATSVEGLPGSLVKRYFVASEGGYRIKKEVRDLVLFARHDLTADPPFLKMDLISCRNLFIYFDQVVQERILKIFHYALNLNGLLFLGKSESLGHDKSFFRTVDPHAKVFERTNRLPAAAISFSKLKYPTQRMMSRALHVEQKARPELERDLIRDFCPDSLVLTDDFRISAVYGNAGQYLQFPDGPMEQKLDSLIHPSLKSQLMTLAHRARRSNQITRSGSILFRAGDKKQYLFATVHPAHAFEEPRFIIGFYTVDFEEPEHSEGAAASSREIDELERELMATREHLQSVIEEQETSNEELQALNEELQSANEELQSSNEELETSNEELQSSNEELTTLNEELNVKSNELTELTAHLNAVQNAIVNPVLVIDANLNLTDFNSKSEEVLGLGPESVGRNFRLISSPFSLEPVFKIIEDCLLHQQRQQTRFESGGFDFDAFCLPIVRDSDGRVTGVVATLVDNTVLLESLRRADIAKRSMYRLMDGIPAKVSVRDSNGVYTYVNPAFCQSLGKAEVEILGRTDVQLFGEETGADRRRKDLLALESQDVAYADEMYPVNGGSRIYHTARVPLWDDDGNIRSVCSVGVDISERAIAEQRLQELQTVIARAEDGFAVLEKREGRFVASFASDTLCELCRIDQNNVGTTTVEDIISCLDPSLSNDRVAEIAAQILHEKKWSVQLVGRHKGEKSYFDVKSFQVEGSKIFLNIFDVTETKSRELRLKQQEEEIEKSGRLAALGQMAAGIAHELKTPLSTIQGYVDLIRELHRHDDSPISAPLKNAIEKIEATTTKMSDIIVGLKSIARSNHNESFEPCSLPALVDDTLKICVFQLRNKGIDLQVEKPNRALTVRAQPTQLSQVLINLINNSVDAIQEMSEKWIRLEIKEDEDDVLVRVIDSGKGISQKILSQVMTPFFTTKRDGTGLGLSLSQSIIKAHGGVLEVDHDCPNTCFQIRIPKSDEDAPATATTGQMPVVEEH
ncbi:PAS domain-containing protein [Proteobacteria bacterium 005FR1]|nr:PAS domain-containing protein [Proteobacteria bacterium 005FR1]